MVTNSFENRNFMQPMGSPSMHSWWALIFPFWGSVGVGRVFFFFDLPCSQCVPNMFSSCSLEVPQVPKLFHNAFPVASQFYPIWFAQSSTLIYINWEGRLLRIHLFLFCNWGSKEVLPLGSAQCSKKIAVGPMNMALSKKNLKSYEHTHELINTNHTKSPTFNVTGLRACPT